MPLKLRRKLKGNVYNAVLCKSISSSEEAADIATGSITEAAFEEALAQVEKEDGAPVPLKMKKVG